MEPLSGLDSAFLALERPSEHLTNGALLVLEPPAGDDPTEASAERRFRQLYQVIGARVHLIPKFRQRVVGLAFGLEHPVWADDPAFSLDRHLHRAAVPAPGGVRELDTVVGHLMAGPLDHRAPLWEMTVLEGLAGGRTAVLAKVHHAVLDGTSGAEILASFLDLGPEPRWLEPAPPWDPEPLPSSATLARRAASSLWHRPSRAVDLVRHAAHLVGGSAGPSEAQVAGGASGKRRIPVITEAFRAPHTSLNGTLSAQRSFSSCRFPLERARQIGKAFGATVNDVVLSATGMAAHRYLVDRGEEPGSSLVAMVPVSTRPPAAGAGGAEPVATGNRLSALFVPLGTDLEDPVERLLGVVRLTAQAKAADTGSGEAVLQDLTGLLVPALISPIGRTFEVLARVPWAPPLCNLIVSNIQGPDESLWLAGRRVSEAYPIGPVAAGVGLNITALSYRGDLQLGILACRRRVPDPWNLARLIRETVEELASALP